MQGQWERSTSSSALWCNASASIAPVVSHEQRASLMAFMLSQYSITGCKHFADKLLHWLRFRLTKLRFCNNIGINSESVRVQRLKFSTVSLVQVSANTCKQNIFKKISHYVYPSILLRGIFTLNAWGENPLFISFKHFILEKYIFIICKQVLETQRKLKQSRMVKYGNILDNKMSSQCKSNNCMFFIMFIPVFKETQPYYVSFTDG